MPELFNKVKTWYFGLPWWGKLLGFLVLVLLAVLVILKFVLGAGGLGKSKSDTVHAAGVAQTMTTGKKKEEALATEIKKSEAETAKIEAANAAAEVTTKTKHQEIDAADSFSAVDKTIKTLIFVLFLSIPGIAKAQDAIYDMPQGKDVTLNGVAMRAYTLEEYKVMAHIYVDYRALLDWKARADSELDLYKGMKALYEQKDETCHGMLTTMTNDRDFWKTRFEEVSADKSKIIERVGFIGALVLETAALVVWGAYSWTH
jgi:Sec-independent protein translocase protein TatA